MGLDLADTRWHTEAVDRVVLGATSPAETKMPYPYALLSLVYMMCFVILFDRMHYKNKLGKWLRGGNLMSRQELDQLQVIWAACQE